MERIVEASSKAWRRVGASIDVKSPTLDRLRHDLSNGMLSDVIGDLETHQLRLGSTENA
jgi:hypothetical protein